MALFRKRPTASAQPNPAGLAAWVSQPISSPAETQPAAPAMPPPTGAPVMPAAPAFPVPATPDPGLAARREQAETIRRGGRPRTDNPRSKSLNVRFTEDEWARVTERAEAAGRKPRELAREALLHGTMVAATKQRERGNVETRGEIARIGNNVNQVARVLHESQVSSGVSAIEWRAALAQINAARAELEALRVELAK